MGRKGFSETLDGQIRRRRREMSPDAVAFRGGDKRRCRVVPFQYEFAAEDLVTAHVGSAGEFGEDRKMWLLHLDGAVGRGAILQHEEITEKRLGAVEVGAFPIGSPQVEGASHRLFGSVVEIVTE